MCGVQGKRKQGEEKVKEVLRLDVVFILKVKTLFSP